MSYVDLICQESISLISGVKNSTCINDKLCLGNNFEIYLSFELPPAAFFNHIIKARLILFKIPFNFTDTHSNPWNNQYSVYPLLDFFSAYSNWYEPPKTDNRLKINYEDQASISYSEIDITKIAEGWINKKPENKGLLLRSTPDARCLVYASAQNMIIGMRPFIRLTYRGFSKPLSAAPCIVNVE
ncbi:MAG: DNRLRE domain-containing protein [Lachnospiraceae bacterium]|nr:DNRLRE domain-containing protein [Lachnospiraceae bacterium]